MASIRIERICPEREGAVGQVWYEITHDNGGTSFAMQRFSRTGQADGDSLVWQASGQDEALTLTPSFLGRFTWGPDQTPVVIHLFLTDGKIVLCGDSTVEVG